MSRAKKILGFAAVPVAASLAFTAMMPAHSAPAPAPAPASVDKAIAVYVTPRGQQYVYDNLEDIMFLNGYSLSEGGFESWHYKAAEPLVLDKMPIKFQQFNGTLGKVRDLMKQWLRGFDFNDPLFEVDAESIQYLVKFNKVGVIPDLDATLRLNQPNSVIMNFDVEIPDMRVEIQSVRAWDDNNAWLKTFGVNNVYAGLADQSEPVKIHVPILFAITPGGGMQTQLLGLTSNLHQVALDFGFDQPMLLPKVDVIINGKVIPVNQKTLEKKLLAEKPKLVQALQTYLADYAEGKVPDTVNNLLATKLPQGFRDLNYMQPAGGPTGLPDSAKFKWGIIPKQISLSGDHLYLGVDGVVWDPLKPDSGSQFYVGTNPAPRVDQLGVDKYDVAIGIHEKLINRMMELSFRRGYFDSIPVGNGETFALTRQPVIRMDGTMPRDQAKLHLRISQHVAGISKLVVRNPFEFELDINVRLVPTRSGDASLVIDQIDENSINVESKYIKMGVFRGTVLNKVRSKIRKANQGFRAKSTVLVPKMPFPDKLGGIPYTIKDFQSDANGYLMLYVELDRGLGRK